MSMRPDSPWSRDHIRRTDPAHQQGSQTISRADRREIEFSARLLLVAVAIKGVAVFGAKLHFVLTPGPSGGL